LNEVKRRRKKKREERNHGKDIMPCLLHRAAIIMVNKYHTAENNKLVTQLITMLAIATAIPRRQ